MAEVVAQVSGRLESRGDSGGPQEEFVFEPGRMRVLGGTIKGPFYADDARLDGKALYTFNEDFLRPNLGSVWTVSALIENDSGSWAGILQDWGTPEGTWPDALSGVLSGDGAYEGQSAYLQFTPTDDNNALAFNGYVFPGEMPEAP